MTTDGMKIALAHRLPVVRERLIHELKMLGHQVVFETAWLGNLPLCFGEHHPNVFMMDVTLAKDPHLSVMDVIYRVNPYAAVIALGPRGNGRLVEACKMGAAHYICWEPDDPSSIQSSWVADTIARIHEGVYAPGYQQTLLGNS